jgi:hypothetical protein
MARPETLPRQCAPAIHCRPSAPAYSDRFCLRAVRAHQAPRLAGRTAGSQAATASGASARAGARRGAQMDPRSRSCRAPCGLRGWRTPAFRWPGRIVRRDLPAQGRGERRERRQAPGRGRATGSIDGVHELLRLAYIRATVYARAHTVPSRMVCQEATPRQYRQSARSGRPPQSATRRAEAQTRGIGSNAVSRW